MKKRVLSLFLAITLCLSLTPTGALAEEPSPEQTVSVTQEAETGADENAPPAKPEENPTENSPAAAEKNTADEETDEETGKEAGEETGKQAVQNEPTMEGKNELLALNDAEQNAADNENGEAGGTSISEEDTRTEIWCTSKPDSIGRGYDGTTDGGTIPIDLTFTDGTNEIKLKEGTGFTAKKTFDSADAGWHTVTVEIALTGEAAVKYKLKAGEETFTIGGNINKAYPKLTVTLSKTACTAGEKLLPLLSVEGAPEDAEVTYYYLASEFKSWAGSSDVEGSEVMPKIDENTAISVPGTYYVYAKSGGTKNYEEERSATVELTVTEPAAASVTKADGTDGGTYKTLPAALDAAQNGDTVKLLADHTTNWSDVDAGEYATLAVVRKTLTLDLNGMTVDYLTVGDVVPDEAGGIIDSYDGNLTVVDNIQGGSCGKIKDLEFVKGSLTIQGGRIGGSLTCDGNSGTVTISGGTVCYVTVGDGATVTVTGGTGHAGTWCNDGTLNITDGTFGNVNFLNNGGTIAISGGTFGTITNINGSSSIPLMPLLADNYAFYQGDNAQNSTEKTLTNVTVRPHTHSFENGKCDCGVAAIVVDNNNSCYNTLQAALGAAADNASITSVTLGQDLTEDIMFSGSAAGSLTLNMNGHKLETEAGVPLIVTGGTLRIEGAGEINQNTASNATAFPAIALTGGKLVIAGDLTAQGGYNSSNGRKPAIRAEEEGELDLQGNVSLNGGLTILDNAKLTNLLTKGTFYAQDPNGNATADNVLAVYVRQEDAASDNYNTVLKLIADGYAIYKKDGTVINATTLTLNSDTYSIGAHTCNYTQDAYGLAYCKCGRSHAHRDLSEEKSVLVNGVCPICGYHCPHKNIGDDGVCTDCKAKMLAKVTVGETTTYTADLADALNKAANGTTITLLADTEISAYVNIYDETATGADQMVVTLDLAGHTVTSNCKPIVIGADRNITASYYGTLKIVGTGNITLEYAILNAREKGVLDLTDWTGGSISSVTVTRNGNTNEEGKLIVGKDAGHIGSLAFYNWPSAEITNTKLYGGSYGEITTSGSDTISLAGLLPNGCAFKNEDGSLANATASRLCNVTVSACDHGGAQGFDESATACPYCGAPAVAETALNHGEGRRFADLQTALDVDRDGGATLQLLADVTDDYTIDGTQDTGLDLNGHSIKGTVTVKAAAGSNTTTLSNTKNTTTVSIDKVVAHKGAKLAGSGYPAVIGELTLADTTKWKDILQQPTRLGFRVTNADGTHKWYAPNDVKDSQLNNVIINSLPITSKTLNLKVDGKNLTGNPPKVERGTTVQLCASCNAKGADVYIYTGEIVGNNMPAYSRKKAEYQKIGTNWYYVVDLHCNTIGKYSVYFTATKDGYSVQSAEKKLTVTKPNLSNAEITFPDGNEAAFNYWTATDVPTFIVTYKGQTLEKDKDFTIAGGGSTYDVGPCTLTIKATDNGDYTGSKSAQWNVRPLKVAVSVGDIIKTYDGTKNLPENTKITFKSADSYYTGATLPLAKGTDYEVLNARYDSADAGIKTVSFTIKLKNAGYVFEDGTTQKDFTLNGADFDDKTFQINKATAPMNNPIGTLNIINGTQQTYTYDFNNILPGLPGGKYGTISYGQADISLVSQSGYYYDETIVEFKKGVLTLAQFYAKDGKMTGKIGTVKVNVTTTNYADFQLKLVLNAVDQIKPVPDGTITAAEITYGDTLSKSKISGKMKDLNTGDAVNGTFAWTDGTIKPAASDNYEAEWTFTPAAGYEKYATATGTVTIKVNKATPTFTAPTAQENLTYTGQEQALITAGMTNHGTMQYSLTENGKYSQNIPTGTDAGAYTVWYRVIGDANHNDTAPASVAVRIGQKPLTITGVTAASKPYDGTTNADITSVTFDGVNLNRGTDYTVTASFDDASVGNNKMVTATVTLMEKTAKNYALEQSSLTTTGSITKAAIDPSDIQLYQTVFNDLAKTYKIDLNQFLDTILPEGGKYGDIQYGKPRVFMNSDYYPDGGATIGNGNLSLSINKAASSNQGDEIGTVTVQVETTNYQPFTLTIHVSLQDKLVPVLAKGNTVSASEITYGQTLADSKLTVNGTMKDPNTSATVDGTFTWTDGTIKPDAGSYDAEWTFTPAEGYEEYATATGTVTVKVKPAKLIVSVKASSMYYTGEEQIASIIASGESVDSTPVTFTYSTTENGIYTAEVPAFTDAGTYTVYYKAEAANHEPATGTFTVTIDPLPISLLSVSSISKTYDGSADVTLTADKLTFFSKTAKATNIKLPDTALTFSDAQFTSKQEDGSYLPSPEVGNGKALSFTMTLTSNNYVFEGKSEGTTKVSDVFATDDVNRFTITKAAAPTVQPVELTIYNGVHKTYSIDLSTLLPKLTAPCDYGTITYDKKIYTNLGVGSFITLVNGKTGELTLEANRSGTDEGQFGTITVTISTSNYQDITLTVKVSAVNQITPVPEDGKITASKITYGQALSDSTITGTVQDPATGDAVDGTFTWDTPDVNPNAGSYDAKWTFTPNKSYGGKYTTYTDTATVTVNPKEVTVSGITANGKVYDGTTDAVLDYSKVVLDGVLENDTLTVTATGKLESADVGKQKVTISDLTLDGNPANNYVLAESGNQTETTATITAKEVTVTPDNKSKVYEEKDPDLTYQASGVLDGETLKDITLTRAEGENVGEYAITATADAGANPNYDVTFAEGTLTIEPKSIKGATVVLGKGLIANGAEQTQTVEKVLLDGKELPADSYTVADNTATTPGSHTLTITAKGNYTGTVEQTYVIIPAKAESAPGEEIAIGSGKVKVDVKSEGIVPPATLLTNKAELLAMLVDSGDITADELAQIADGASVDIVLTVKEANVSDEVKTAMAQAAKDYTIGQYLDISLFKYMTVNGSQQAGVPLHTTKDALTISVVVPDALIHTDSAVNRNYCIVRNHEGTITVLDAAFDAAGKTLTFKTDRFSIYAIAYKDTAVPSSGSNPGSNNSSNDSETKKNEVAAPTPAPTPASTSKPSTITAMPQTGDTSNPTLYVVLLVASLLGLAVVFVCKKRNNK